MRVRLIDNEGRVYIVRPDEIKPARERKKRMRFAKNVSVKPTVFETDANTIPALDVKVAITSLIVSLLKGEMNSFSFSVYNGSPQITIWQEVNGKKQPVANKNFASLEELVVWIGEQE